MVNQYQPDLLISTLTQKVDNLTSIVEQCLSLLGALVGCDKVSNKNEYEKTKAKVAKRFHEILNMLHTAVDPEMINYFANNQELVRLNLDMATNVAAGHARNAYKLFKWIVKDINKEIRSGFSSDIFRSLHLVQTKAIQANSLDINNEKLQCINIAYMETDAVIASISAAIANRAISRSNSLNALLSVLLSLKSSLASWSNFVLSRIPRPSVI